MKHYRAKGKPGIHARRSRAIAGIRNNRHAVAAITVPAIPVLMALGIGAAYVNPFNMPAAHALPACQYEDGNVDGQPCAWIDPDTGRQFYVTSENYR